MSEPASADSGAGRFARLRWIARVARHPSALLLLAQLLMLLLYPFAERTRSGSAALATFGTLVLLLAIRMNYSTMGRTWTAAAIALPTVALNLVGQLPGHAAWLPLAAAFEAVFYFYAAYGLIVYMLGDRRATSDELFAAGATFTVLAWAFAYVFVLCQALQPGCVAGAADRGAPRSWIELMFLSFALLSSTGIGDVVPTGALARAVGCIEMFAGVMYLTLVVSRLIGLTLLARDER